MSRDQDKDKTAVLEQLRKTPIVQVVCERAGIPRSTYYRWRKSSKRFKKACDDAVEEGSGLINDMAESQLINAIKEKNLTAIMFWLKSHHRGYANRIELDAHHKHQSEELSPEQAALVEKALMQLKGADDEPVNQG